MSRPIGNFLAVFCLAGIATSISAAPVATSVEYQNLGSARHFDAINVLPAWARGATGQGVTIALIDSGIDLNNPEFINRIAGGGRNFVSNDNNLQDDATGHGTAVAGIIAANHQNAGIVGVAYQARILPYKIFQNERGGGSIQVLNAINAAASNSAVRVLNLSFGGAQFLPAEMAALQNAVINRKFVAIAAGNSGAPSPEYPAALAHQLGTGVIAVGSLGIDGQIAFFSNRAGPTMNSFLLAPGFNIWSTAPGNIYKPVSGTSFSAAYVSGAAALLFQLYPNLTGADVGGILLASADDIGAPGPDPTNGRGRLNIGRAIGPLGTNVIPAGSNATQGGAPLDTAALQIAPAFGAALLAQRDKLTRVIFLDGFDRPYRIDLSKLIQAKPARHPLHDMFAAQLEDTRSFTLPIDGRHQLSVGYTPATVQVVQREHDPQLFDAWSEFGPVDIAASFTGETRGWRYRLDLNQQQHGPGIFGAPGSGRMDFINYHALTTPYLGFSERAHAISTAIPVSPSIDVNFLYTLQHDGDDYGLNSSAAMVELSWRVNRNLDTRLHIGQLTEHGSLLGGASGGSFSVEQANTRSAGIGAVLHLNETWRMVVNADMGITKVASSDHSLLQPLDALMSDSYSMGLLGKNLWRRSDELGFALTRPLRVRRGHASLSIPVAMDANEELTRRNIELNLSPAAQQLDLEAYYRLPLGPRTRLAANLLVASHPNHSQDAGPAIAISTSIRHDF